MSVTGHVDPTGPLKGLVQHSDPSWVRQLTPDPEQEAHVPNRSSRKVRSGHYVLVEPTPLPAPELVHHSPAMAAELGLSEEACRSEDFLRLFSGAARLTPDGPTWATPYALSIYGQEMYRNCPFGTGEGYGDGRAISIGEVLLENGQRWEFQLKGGGRTPFCRSGDGRAVLRSSIREFLVSEAMHRLGVSTTRALSLIRSNQEAVMRPWYSNTYGGPIPTFDDPRLKQYPPDMRRMLIEQLKDQLTSPDVMAKEPCAITCRVAPSFLRVGHVELFGRRAAGSGEGHAVGLTQLQAILRHALYREYPECLQAHEELEPQVLCMLRTFSARLANLTAEWIRVGYCQGNFNSDNCLVGGRTMDYGPFGFIQRFEPLWNMWQSGGQHFGFLNQPQAGARNFTSLVGAVLPALSPAGRREAQDIGAAHEGKALAALDDVWRRKLGLSIWDPSAAALMAKLLRLMEDSQADYTLLFRQLAVVAEAQDPTSLGPLQEVFYAPLTLEREFAWGAWVRDWRQLLADQGRHDGAAVATDLRAASPKYVPREWMLVDAYTAATPEALATLQALFADPYATQPEPPGVEERFYRKARPETYEGAGVGGTSFMT